MIVNDEIKQKENEKQKIEMYDVRVMQAEKLSHPRTESSRMSCDGLYPMHPNRYEKRVLFVLIVYIVKDFNAKMQLNQQ